MFALEDDSSQSWPSVLRMIRYLRSRSFGLGLATPRPRAELERALQPHPEILEAMDVVVTASDVSSPDALYTECARRLRCDATRVVAVVESPAAIEAAKRARMLTVAVGPAAKARFSSFKPTWMVSDVSKWDASTLAHRAASDPAEPADAALSEAQPPADDVSELRRSLAAMLPSGALAKCLGGLGGPGYGPVRR